VAPIVSLDEPSDPRLACYTDLRWNAKPGPESDWFIVEGRFCVQRLIESPIEVVSILVELGKEAEVASWFTDQTPVYSLPAESIRSLVGYDFHRGILACGRRPKPNSIDALRWRESEHRLALAAVGVNQQENLGSMMRTAAALGIEQVLIGPRTADPYSRRAVRVSMATVLKLKLTALVDPVPELRQLQETGRFRTVVTTLSPDATTLDQFVADDRACILVMGSELEGVGPEIEEIATDRVTIPMRLGTDSLNVSVAAAIFMYELTRRRR
jgi:tRNA G18 (ribose-2'-O)-methylase SpoU